ncbi:helix-turn-helix domain-containing protein [Cytobacillus sp. IB215665]|uniref:helix-turn-helix domain-containing protein n=1 Tax=Cytobacillus sp. IB215665 TaxID=3097357 RepID=UPI002A105424|nr:helix-turn-helix domain-containing protein [Cytobacillus sp. IB215665]MDX8365442.1 helix-turn-helix domain-containing protein [Cytobacillus sp. IB215665]
MDNIAKIIGEEIRYLRKKAGLTQIQLAQGTVTQAQISKIERGEVLPLCTTLYEIAETLGLDVNYFYNLAYTPRFDYVTEVKKQIRDAIRKRNYTEVESMINDESNSPTFRIGINHQFLLWHKGIVEFYVYKNVEKSLELLFEALYYGKHKELPILKLQQIEILNSIGIIYNETEDYLKSIEVYKEAFVKLQDLPQHDLHIEIRLCYSMAKSLHKINEFQQSLTYSQRGLNLCVNEEILYLLGELHHITAQSFEQLENKKNAYDHFIKAKNLFEIEGRFHFADIANRSIIELLGE